MRILTAAALVAGAALLGACVPQQQQQLGQPAIFAPERGQACDTSFRVVNNSSRTVSQLYFSHSSLSAWGNDQLGQNVLPPGRSVNYRAANPGSYDFRVVYAGGGEAQLRRVNICTATQVTVTNSGLVAR